jgi:hypothetical protein
MRIPHLPGRQGGRPAATHGRAQLEECGGEPAAEERPASLALGLQLGARNTSDTGAALGGF